MPEGDEYSIVFCVPADEKTINDTVDEYREALERSPKTSSREGWVSLGKFGIHGTTLFHSGINLNSNKFILDRCGPYEQAEKDTVILSMVKNDQQLQPWRIMPGKVLVIRPVTHELNASVGFPKSIKGSHRMSSIGEVMGAPEEELIIGLNQALIIDGDVVIRFPRAGGGVCMMEGIMKK
ncbi:hypothetical protein TESG_07294 [Trichophyton tonsurans CBS 112818]|uniref:Uncharacterized protein n=1 Tax=Trichophyton tonsurans (strain CBS 112818) TaxID=647933 RepID=F2S8R7_TRIT1|nr:hypothetical protein TESG_07294 [Trichophyton tonsurans CBS 112818]